LFLGKDDESSRWKNNKFLLFDGKFNKWKLWVFFALKIYETIGTYFLPHPLKKQRKLISENC
jgi:hypothetical protein